RRLAQRLGRGDLGILRGDGAGRRAPLRCSPRAHRDRLNAMHDNPFSDTELAQRIERTQAGLVERELYAAIFASPENVFYLTGLDHWGYFVPHLLLVPVEGKPVLVTRAMERVSVEKQVRSAEFRGHSDSE